MIYNFSCKLCNKDSTFYITADEYDNTDWKQAYCTHCNEQGSLYRTYTVIPVIYKSMGFYATDSIVESPEMDQVMGNRKKKR